MSDTKKIRALKKVSGMLPGVIYDKPTAIADVLINGGHAVSVDTLAERAASEQTTGGWERNEVVVRGERDTLLGVADEPDSFVNLQHVGGDPVTGVTTEDPDAPTHKFEPYDANPTICRHCGAVKPGLCYRIKVD